MNPEEYAAKAITIDPLMFDQSVDINEAGTVVLRFGYPQPGSGVALLAGPRGEVNGSIDFPADRLREWAAALIRNVAEDCISVVKQTDGIDGEAKLKLERAIQRHFEMLVH